MAGIIDLFDLFNRAVTGITSITKNKDIAINDTEKYREVRENYLPRVLSPSELKAIQNDIIWSVKQAIVKKNLKNIRWIIYPIV